MKFIKAKSTDAERIWEIISYAKNVRKAQGSQQWQDGYPNRETIHNDIANGYAYVWTENDAIIAYAAIIPDIEPAYEAIEGKWLSDQPYVVVHRIAVSEEGKGKSLGKKTMEEVERIALENNILSIKIDTNFDNHAMLSILEKKGYTYCGEVHFRGAPRRAYEKILSKS